MANTIAFLAIVATISLVTIFGAETPINTSLFFITSTNVPLSPYLLVTANISFCAQFISSESSCIAPFISHKTIFFTFKLSNIFAMAIPAEPAPFITISKSSILFPASFAAFKIPAETMIAVPC